VFHAIGQVFANNAMLPNIYHQTNAYNAHTIVVFVLMPHIAITTVPRTINTMSLQVYVYHWELKELL